MNDNNNHIDLGFFRRRTNGAEGESEKVTTPHYGSSHLLAAIKALLLRQPVNPKTDLESIKNQAMVLGPAGEENVRKAKTAEYRSQNEELIHECVRVRGAIVSDRKGAERQCQELSAVLAVTQRFFERIHTAVPWTGFHLTQFWVLAILSVAMVIVGQNTTAVTLQASGSAGFDSPIRAYLFTVIPVMIGVGLKFLGAILKDPQKQRLYTYALWIIGLIFSVGWVNAFSEIFPGLTQSIDEIITDCSQDNASAPPPVANNRSFIVLTIAAEAFLAAASWMTMLIIYERHSPSVRKPNPAYHATQRELDRWKHYADELDQALGNLDGKIKSIEEAQVAYVENAVNFYRKIARLSGGDEPPATALVSA